MCVCTGVNPWSVKIGNIFSLSEPAFEKFWKGHAMQKPMFSVPTIPATGDWEELNCQVKLGVFPFLQCYSLEFPFWLCFDCVYLSVLLHSMVCTPSFALLVISSLSSCNFFVLYKS